MMAVSPRSDARSTAWPEAVQYFLRHYAMSKAMRSAILDLRYVTQNNDEDETKVSSRLNNEAHICGSIHSMDDKMTLYIDGLQKATTFLVAVHRERHTRTKFLELVRFAPAKVDAVRARELVVNG